MVRIAHVTWPSMSIDYGWMFKISSYSDLLCWWMDVKQPGLREGFANYLNSREFVSLFGVGVGDGYHLSHGEASFLHSACLAEAMKDIPRSAVEIFCDITDAVYRGMSKVLQENGCIYVNKNGGYFHLTPNMREVETREVPEFILPGATLEIKQWPNGKHYYAYVGGVHVERNGSSKWSTRAMAQIQAENWAKEHNVSIDC